MNWGGVQAERVRFFAAYRSVPFVVLRLLALLTLLLSVCVLLLAVLFSLPTTLVGFALIALGPSLAVCSFHLYATSVWTDATVAAKPNERTPLNYFDLPSVTALLAYHRSGTRTAFWVAFLQVPEVEGLLFRLGLSEKRLADLYLNTHGTAEEFVQAALERHPGHATIDVFEAVAIALTDPILTNYFTQAKISQAELAAVTEYYSVRYRANRGRRFWDRWQRKSGGFAKLWATSYTTLLDRFTQEVGPNFATYAQFSPLYGRAAVVDQLVVELNKQAGQNVLLVGEAGVGKSEVFYSLAARVVSYQTKTRLDGMQVRILDLAAVLAAAPKPEDQAPLFEALFADISRAGNVLLFVPRIDLLLSGQSAGSADAANLLTQYLTDSRIHIIGTITPEYHVTMVRSQPILAENFTPVTVEPPSDTDLLRILLVHLPIVERRYQTFFLATSLTMLMNLAGRYVKDEVSPEREIRLMEEVAAHVQSGGHIVTSEDVTAVIEQRANVRLQVDETEQETLLNLAEELHRRVVGQERAIKLVSDALLRARAGLTKGTKPIGSFLFLGPTGVGKTETAKALADIYFGSTANLIRLDMSEYADANGLEKLLGSDPVKQLGSLTVAVQKTPSAVILFDEIEKASATVRNVMLQLLDEGHLTTNFGKVLDFTNTIVIATSNAGSDFIKEQLQKRTAPAVVEKQLIDRLIADRVYAPEYLNRFDGVVVYLPLTKAEIKQVVQLQLTSLAGLMQKEKGILLSVSDSVVATLAERGYDPVFGARALQRVIKDELETAIARQIIAEKPQPGSTVTISAL